MTLFLFAVFEQTLHNATYQVLVQAEIARMVEKGISPLEGESGIALLLCLNG
jgi:hypothetical protein